MTEISHEHSIPSPEFGSSIGNGYMMVQMYSILGTIQLGVIKNTVLLSGLQLRPLKIKYLLLVPLTFTQYSCAYFSHISIKTLSPSRSCGC